MANQELIAYIKQNSAAFTKLQLTQTLVAGGWSAPDVAAAFAEVENPPPAVPVPPPAPVAPAPAPVVVPVIPPVQPAPIAQPIFVQPNIVVPANPMPPTATEQKTTTNFLAEMEAHRKEAGAAYAPIIEGNTQIRPNTPASYLHAETKGALATEQKGIIGRLIKTGLVKNEQQANIVMIVFLVVALGIVAWLLWPSSGAAPVKINPLPVHIP